MKAEKLRELSENLLKIGFPPHQVYQAETLYSDITADGDDLLYWLFLFEAAHRDRGHLRLPLDSTGLNRSLEDWDWGWNEETQWLEQRSRICLELKEGLHRLLEEYPQIYQGQLSPYQWQDNCLYTRRQFRREEELKESLLHHFRTEKDLHSSLWTEWDSDAVSQAADSLKGKGLDLSVQSLEALERIFHNPVSIISGGPGTGKTTTLVFILSLLQEMTDQKTLPQLPRILLAAPTGRAAKRMEEALRERTSLDLKAFTLHKLLGLGHSTSARWDRNHPLPADLVVVDEASMVDVSLMSRLLEALMPETALLLIGDKDQLPSVDSGALLGDLLQDSDQNDHPLHGAVTLLNKVYRSEGRVLELAGMIQQGQMELADRLLPFKDTELSFSLPELQHFPEEPRQLIHWLASAFVLPRERSFPCFAMQWASVQNQVDQWFQLYQDLVLLCPMRRGLFGVDRLNQSILGRLYGEEGDIHHGQPVMITRNDYELNLFNGDRGVLFRFQDFFYALFPDEEQGYRAVPLAYLKHWETCYAQTVHKSQGSEYQRVIVLLPPGGESLLYRELLYTAVTRARTEVSITADKNSLVQCLKRRIFRSSGLGDIRLH